MKQHLSLTDLAAELERRQAAKQDYLIDTRELTMLTSHEDEEGAVRSGPSELAIPRVGEFVANEHTHSQVADRLKVPKRFYDRLRADYPALLDQTVNTIFRKEPERRMVRTYNWGDDGGGRVARAFLSDRYRRLDDFDLASAILPVLGEIPGLKIESTGLTETRMYIKAFTETIQREVKKVGDIVRAGLMIRNSEVGNGALTVQPMLYTLACTNGMVVGKATRKYHVGRQIDSDDAFAVFRDETIKKDDEAFFAKVADVVRAAVSETQFNAIIAAMDEAVDTRPMDNPIKGMEVLAKRLDLSERESGSVLQHLIKGGDLTQYGALNAVTRAAQDQESYDRATDLEELGSTVLAMPRAEWEAVATAV